MTDKVTLYSLHGSPNSMKVRIALGYKKIPHERIDVNPQDRSELIRVSGQPLAPVLVHGDRAVFDSAAILRYLDGNFRDTPPLFSAEYDTIKKIEEYEFFARTQLGRPVGMIFGLYFAPEKDPHVAAEASAKANELSSRLEEQLSRSEWLVGDRMTAADVTAAPYVWLGMLPEAAAEDGEVAAFFLRNLHLGEGREKTRAWVSRVIAYDL